MADKNLLIYLVDDDEDDRMIFEDALKEVSTQIELVALDEGGKLIQALKKAEKLPDIIFLDLNMPNKNGKETLKDLRQLSHAANIPVIIYSTSTSDVDIDQTYEAGANTYFEKPYSLNYLIEGLRKLTQFDWINNPRPSRENYFIHSRDQSTGY